MAQVSRAVSALLLTHCISFAGCGTFDDLPDGIHCEIIKDGVTEGSIVLDAEKAQSCVDSESEDYPIEEELKF
jgi:hypothetical protein